MLNPVIHTLIYDTHVNISESYTLVDTNMKFHSLDTSGKKKTALMQCHSSDTPLLPRQRGTLLSSIRGYMQSKKL